MRLEEITRSVDTLPAMGGAALRVLALIEDAQASAARIEKALREDPGVTANLLRLANSAYFGIPSRIGSLRQAVSLLGLRRVTQMVVAACAAAVLQRPVEGYDLPAGELWRHSLAVSVAAEGLVRELGIGAGEEIFTAALLHDVGKIVLGRFVSEEMVRIEAALGRGLTFEEAETAALGVDHAAVGADLLARWALPADIVYAVRWHHDPDRAPASHPMLDVVHVANVLCRMIGIGLGREGLQTEPSETVTRRLGVGTGHLERVASRTLQWANELAQALAA